jgi:hypothetical protein
MQDKTWTDTFAVTFPEEDIKLLKDVEVMTNNLIGQVYIFIDLLQQYNQLVEQSSIFAPAEEENKNDDMSDGPTQTVSQPALGSNRESRRAEEKKKSPPPQGRKMPFQVAKEKGHTPNDMR